jgi:hypothetical protein
MIQMTLPQDVLEQAVRAYMASTGMAVNIQTIDFQATRSDRGIVTELQVALPGSQAPVGQVVEATAELKPVEQPEKKEPAEAPKPKAKTSKSNKDAEEAPEAEVQEADNGLAVFGDPEDSVVLEEGGSLFS